MWPHRVKHKWTKAPQDESPKGSESRRTKHQKMRKYFKTPIIKVYDPMITSYRCGQSTFSSCNHVAAQRKAKMDKSTTGQKPQRSESKWTKLPKMRKYFKTPAIKLYDPMITWYRSGQSTFSSCHHLAAQRKAKVDKSTTGQNPQRIRIKADKPPKMRKYFKTPTIKLYDPMITWYMSGQSSFSSCHHVAAQRKAKMDKSTTERKPQKIRIKADKTPKN